MEKNKKWYKKISNWLFIVGIIILLPILIVNVSIMIQAKQNEDVIPSVFGYKPFIVLSGSMETKIHVGDLIITKEIKPNKLKVDDVIAFRDADDTVTTHRIIDIIDSEGVTYFITKGDNNNTQDTNLVEFEDVEGIYIGRIPGLGSMMDTLSKPTTIVIIVLGITVIFVLSFSISYKKEREEERKEFLEYKRQKEEEEAKLKEKALKKKTTSSKKKSSKKSK